MLFRQIEIEGIAAGSITLAFRRWVRPTVRQGGSLLTAAGVLAIDSVAVVTPETLTDTDAAAAGFAGLDVRAAVKYQTDRDLYRIGFHVSGPDPRIALREESDLDTAAVTEIRRRLGRYDAASTHGPWTHEVLGLIAANPETRAPDLAARRGMATQPFKTDVRKLKALGLTESLAVGYRLSPRGRAYLDAIGGGSGQR